MKILVICFSNEQKQWLNTELQKSSTNSSLQQGSSSSDDIHGQEFVTHRHINSPKFFESENGHHPRDFLQQFTNKIESEELQKKRLRELVRQKTEPLLNTDTDDDDILRSAKSSSTSKNFSGRHLKHSSSTSKASPKIVRTNTYGGRGDRRQRAPDVSMLPNMAETKPIMPQQYRPNRPPPYREALERKEKMKCNVSEMEKIKQTVNSARAKQMYAQSVHLFEQGAKASTTSSSVPHAADVTDSKLSQASLYNNNNTIGVVNTQDTKFIFKRSAKPVNVDSTSRTIFYQPNSSHRIAAHPKSSANLFYRPTQPPPYKEAVKIRNNKPDLIDRLGGESLV
ncbi:hypothetical protein EB796_005106 [Bugula neritina]|uniref:Uncharacterized protein n=1 Tax=Bugula neritina TaxID=10212 RepID=A0A7J7KD32_BUGNE|nr:hypothetical protein EB796_005106 [Bugula neritina]